MPDPLFTDMYRDTEQLTWAPVEQVRRRGRRRTRRTRIAAGLASAVAVAVVATGAVALAGGQGTTPPPVPPATGSPSPTATPSPAPSPTASPTASPTPAGPASSPGRSTTRPTAVSDPAIPSAALLRTADLPSGYRAAGSDLGGDWSLDAATIRCRNEAPPLTVRERAERGAVFRAAGDLAIIERVRRYTVADARTAVDRARRTVTGCQPHRPGDSMSVLDTGFAGDESLLIGSSFEGTQSRWLFVRQGDLVAEVWLDSMTDAAAARRLAQRAADRLCAGTDAC